MSDFTTSPPPPQRPSVELGPSVPHSLSGVRRLSTSTFSSSNRTTRTPHPSTALHYSTNQAAEFAAVSGSGTRSATRSSYRPGRRSGTSTVSGRKTQATSSIWGSDGHQVICAVSEARGVSPSVGLAFVNITTNEAILSQICDSQFYVKTVHKIQIYDPVTILIVNTAFPPNPKSTLLSILEEELQGTSIEPLDRRYWSEVAGLEYIRGLAFREDIEAIEVATQGNFFATCSFAAVCNPSAKSGPTC
jgi:DNA mismatch repair protein MSH4